MSVQSSACTDVDQQAVHKTARYLFIGEEKADGGADMEGCVAVPTLPSKAGVSFHSLLKSKLSNYVLFEMPTTTSAFRFASIFRNVERI